MSSIAWAHKLADVVDPTKAGIVSSTYEGLKRRLSKPTVKKEPITIDIIHKLVSAHIPDRNYSTNLKNLRVVAMCVVSFAGFLRYNELSQI